MNPRITLIIVIVFAVLLGYVYFVELNKTPAELGTPVPTPQPSVLQVAESNVKTIEIRDLRAPREVRLTRVDTGWQVTQPISKAADSPTVERTLTQLASLQATRVLTNVTDLAPYGFSPATLEVRLIMTDTTPYALTIGDKTPDGSNYYATYTGDKSKVFLLGGSTVEELTGWLATPPYEPTPTPTYTPTPPVTPTVEETGTPGATAAVTPTAGTSVPPPNIVPTIAIPTPLATPTR